MERFIEFITHHYILVSAFLGLLIAYVLVKMQRGGRSVSPQTLTSMVNKQKALVIDLRDPNEFKQGHITGSRNIPYARLTEKLQELPKDCLKKRCSACSRFFRILTDFIMVMATITQRMQLLLQQT